jgi:hypothetical protein
VIESNEILVSWFWILFWIIFTIAIIVGCTTYYINLVWKKHKNKYSTLKDFYMVGVAEKFYEIVGFGVACFGLLFAILSMTNTIKLERAKFDKPIIEVKALNYKNNNKQELKLVIEVITGRIPSDPLIEFVPVFRYRDKEKGWMLSKKEGDFSFKIHKNFAFKKNSAGTFRCEILRLRNDICDRPSYKTFCDLVKKGDAELVMLYYRIYGGLGLVEKVLLKEGEADVKEI